MIKIFTFLLFLLTLVRTELTLERIDAITDLSALAKKHFSEEPNLRYEEPNAKMINAFAWSVSDMWDENESALYVLTRLAKLVDERDENGQLSIPARVIRSFAEKSEARKVYMTTVESSNAAMFASSSESTFGEEEKEIERLYLSGIEAEADSRVVKLIDSRWSDAEKAYGDLETAAKNGNFNLMTALIKLGKNHNSLKFTAPELKAGLIIRLLSLQNAQIQPAAAKWLLTMDTFREDQLKLVKTIEKALKKRSTEIGQEKMMTTRTKNNLMEVFGEVETITSGKKTSELSDEYFNGIASLDGNGISKALYKKMKTTESKQKGQKVLKNAKQQQQKIEIAVKLNEQENNTTKEQLKDQQQEQEKQQQEESLKEQSAQESSDKINEEGKKYFEEEEEHTRQIDVAIYENNDEPLYDNDGVYDDDEKKRDRIAQIVVIALVGSIIATAVGTYIYLRARRARRNRTMIVVTEALETVA